MPYLLHLPEPQTLTDLSWGHEPFDDDPSVYAWRTYDGDWIDAGLVEDIDLTEGTATLLRLHCDAAGVWRQRKTPVCKPWLYDSLRAPPVATTASTPDARQAQRRDRTKYTTLTAQTAGDLLRLARHDSRLYGFVRHLRWTESGNAQLPARMHATAIQELKRSRPAAEAQELEMCSRWVGEVGETRTMVVTTQLTIDLGEQTLYRLVDDAGNQLTCRTLRNRLPSTGGTRSVLVEIAEHSTSGGVFTTALRLVGLRLVG